MLLSPQFLRTPLLWVALMAVLLVAVPDRMPGTAADPGALLRGLSWGPPAAGGEMDLAPGRSATQVSGRRAWAGGPAAALHDDPPAVPAAVATALLLAAAGFAPFRPLARLSPRAPPRG